MSLIRIPLVVAVVIAALIPVQPAAASSLRETARQVLKSQGDAIITIEVVTLRKYTWGARQQESEDKEEILGVVLDNSGLVVTALSSVDPSGLMRLLQASMDDDMRFTTTVRDIKYIMPDNSEVPATIVLRDSDLDLVYLRPLESGKEFVHIDFTTAVEAKMLDEVFTIGRMGRIARRTPLGMTGEIQGVVSRPRTYYITSGEVTSAGTGVPVFNADGSPLGIVTLHALVGASSMSGSGESVIPVVIPAEDILEGAARAPQETKPLSEVYPEEEAAGDVETIEEPE